MKAISEKDAANKVCPILTIASAIISKDNEEATPAGCIGSNCILWNAVEIYNPTENTGEWLKGTCGLVKA